MRLIFYVLLIFMTGAFSSCRVHQRLDIDSPCVDVPETYTNLLGQGEDYQGQWWKEFNVPELNALVSLAFSHNLDLKQSFWKVAQACWQAKVVGSQKYPEIITAPSIIYSKSSGNTFDAVGGGVEFGGVDPIVGGGSGSQTIYLLSNTLAYEVDLWRRIDSETRAACYELKATQEDLEAAAWLLSGSVVDLWFTIQEQKNLLDVIDNQIEVSKTQLELIELRYSMGQSSSLDVYQQRLQLSEIEQQRTPVETRLQTAQNLMATLLGRAPSNKQFTVEDGLVELPPFPNIGSPVDLLCNRPDLRAIYRRIESNDYHVAAAVADCFPKLSLLINYDFQADSIKDLFNSKISSIITDLAFPIFDGGRRRAEVKRRQAIICELVNAYGQGFLDALLEVEDSLVEEKQQLKFIEQIKHAYEIARVNLEESYWHYVNGENDYLSVIAAIQAEQALERELVVEKKNLLVIRSKLYRSLGGPGYM